MDLISKRQIIEEIRAHAQRVGLDSDLYQLAHDHIIRIIENAPSYEYELTEDSFIFGYRVKDFIIIAERLRQDKNFTDPIVLKADNEAFLEGYKLAHAEIQEQLEKSINNIINKE